MTEIERLIDIPGLPPSRVFSYANAVLAGDFVFVAGQMGVDEHYKLVSREFEPQARRAFENIRVALEAAGATLSDIVTLTAFISDWRYGPDFSQIRGEFLGDDLPASAVVGVGHLAFPAILVEIQCTAVRRRR